LTRPLNVNREVSFDSSIKCKQGGQLSLWFRVCINMLINESELSISTYKYNVK